MISTLLSKSAFPAYQSRSPPAGGLNRGRAEPTAAAPDTRQDTEMGTEDTNTETKIHRNREKDTKTKRQDTEVGRTDTKRDEAARQRLDRVPA